MINSSSSSGRVQAPGFVDSGGVGRTAPPLVLVQYTQHLQLVAAPPAPVHALGNHRCSLGWKRGSVRPVLVVRRPTPPLLAQVVAGAGGVAPGAELVEEAREEGGEPGDSPEGVPALGGRAGQRRSSSALPCASRPAARQSVGAAPLVATAWGLPPRAWVGARLFPRRSCGRRPAARRGQRVPV